MMLSTFGTDMAPMAIPRAYLGTVPYPPMKSLTCVRAGSQGFPSGEYLTHNQLHGNLV